MLKMIAKPLFLVMCAAMSFTAPMDICMAQDKQETLGQSVKEQIPFTLGYLTTTSHLLAFIAKEEGYFAEEGLDVELIPFASAGELATGLEVGKLNVALIGSVPSSDTGEYDRSYRLDCILLVPKELDEYVKTHPGYKYQTDPMNSGRGGVVIVL